MCCVQAVEDPEQLYQCLTHVLWGSSTCLAVRCIQATSLKTHNVLQLIFVQTGAAANAVCVAASRGLKLLRSPTAAKRPALSMLGLQWTQHVHSHALRSACQWMASRRHCIRAGLCGRGTWPDESALVHVAASTMQGKRTSTVMLTRVM